MVFFAVQLASPAFVDPVEFAHSQAFTSWESSTIRSILTQICLLDRAKYNQVMSIILTSKAAPGKFTSLGYTGQVSWK